MIRCFKVRETGNLWITLLSIFQNENQVPQNWQIFYVNKQTQIYELE